MHRQTDKLETAKIALTLGHPFWASLIFDKLTIIESDAVPTAGVTERSKMLINRPWFDQLSVSEGVFVLAHETAHEMFRHFSRFMDYQELGFEGEDFDPFLGNCAADYIINDLLRVCKVGEMVKGGLWRQDIPHTMSLEEAYRKLRDEQPKRPKGRGKKPGGGGHDPTKGTGPQEEYDERGVPRPHDEHFFEKAPANNPQADDQTSWDQAVASAAQAQKSRGDMPAALERLVEEILEPELPWQELLRHCIMKCIGRDERTWSRARRRSLVQQGIYLPGMTGKGSGVVVWCGDTSGSMSSREQAKGLGELQSILSDAHPEVCHVLYGDAKVHTHTILEQDMDVQELVRTKAIKGGGGTDFRPFFSYCEEHGIQPDTLVLFTDSYGYFPNEAPGYPVIVCSTTDKESASNYLPEWGHTFVHVKEL